MLALNLTDLWTDLIFLINSFFLSLCTSSADSSFLIPEVFWEQSFFLFLTYFAFGSLVSRLAGTCSLNYICLYSTLAPCISLLILQCPLPGVHVCILALPCSYLVFPKEDLVFNLSKSVVSFLAGRWMWALSQCASWNFWTARDSLGKVTLPAVCSVQMWAGYFLGGIIPPAFPQGAAGVLEQVLRWAICTLKSPAVPWALCNMGRGNRARPVPAHTCLCCVCHQVKRQLCGSAWLSWRKGCLTVPPMLSLSCCSSGSTAGSAPSSLSRSSTPASMPSTSSTTPSGGWYILRIISLLAPILTALQHPLPPKIQQIGTFSCAVVLKCCGIFGEVCPLHAPRFCRVSSPCDFDLDWIIFRVLINLKKTDEMAGWLPVRACCSSLGPPVKANTPKALGWCAWGYLIEQLLHP